MTQESDFFYFSHQVSLDDVDIDQYKELTESKALVKYLLAFDHSPHFIIDFCKQEVMCYCDRNVTIMHNTAEVEKYIRENLLILDEKYIKTFKEYQEAIFTKMQSLDKDKLLKCSIIYSAHISKYEDVNISSMAVIKSVPILISKKGEIVLTMGYIDFSFDQTGEIWMLYSALDRDLYSFRHGTWNKVHIKPLSAMKKLMLKYASTGMSDKEIAANICSPENTVKDYIRKIRNIFYQNSRGKLLSLLRLLDLI